jgi:hypothetical protein
MPSDKPAAKQAKTDKKDCLYTIFLNPYVKVSLLTYNNDFYLAIRRAEKFICLNIQQVTELQSNIEIISETLDQTMRGDEAWGRFGVGNDVWVIVNSDIIGVDIRKFFFPENANLPHPTRKGIFLKYEEWKKLVNILRAIFILHPDILQQLYPIPQM